MIYLLLLLLVAFVNGDRVVQTNSGPVRGISLDTKNVEAFLGIPYAEPPVGNLRFAKPVPKSPWAETYPAKEVPVACVQPMLEMFSKLFNDSERMNKMDEDCLYLNLWVPKTKSAPKTVMVWIHGGGFMLGSSNIKIYDGAALAEHGDVIVASMNYRVGTLGFFTAFIDEAAGSMGMYDQVLAIQWIKDNAKHFGGDPDNIVLFGESAGSFSVSLHMVSPLSKNLFKRGIMQSGATVSPMFSNDNTALRMSSQMISKHVGCAANDEDLKENPKKVVECMKNLPPEKFVEVDEILFKKLAILVPRVGDEFLPMSPAELMRKGEVKDTEVLLGVTKNEGSMFVAFHFGYDNGDLFGEKIDPKAFDEASAKKVVETFMENEHYAKIIQKYFQRVKEESRYTYLDAIIDIMGDTVITCSAVFHADFQSMKNRPVYFYLFDYRSPLSRFPEWSGVPHFEETPYVFGNPFYNRFLENEKGLSKDMMDMWVAFAKTGEAGAVLRQISISSIVALVRSYCPQDLFLNFSRNPNIPGGLEWPKYTYQDPKYLIISMSDKVGVKPDNYRCEAWRNLYGSVIDEEDIQNFRRSKTEL